ncbi:MAG TPA: phosphotransferase [Actinomycetota bacterium]|nr:phosphotransferase [Actinomycetota bacterium]
MDMSTERLLDWLPQQRWFGHKAQEAQGLDLLDVVVLDDGPPALALSLVKVTFAEGDPALYHLPVLLDEDGTARDAAGDPARLALLYELMAHGHTIKGNHGAVEFGGPGLDPMADVPSAVRTMGAEQSNTSVVLDDATIVKLFRRVEPGANPDLELCRLLTNEGFENVPAQVGELTYRGEIDGEDVSIDLGIAQQFARDATDGWDYALERLRALFDEIDEADVAEDQAFLVEQRAGSFLEAIEDLGEVTGALHVALSREETDPGLAPEPVDELDLGEWAEGAQAYLERLRSGGVAELEAMAPAIADRIDAIRSLADAGSKTRIHGDYHLGQVIRSLKWLILDFEGEPVRSLEERRTKQSPLKDVAGMLRSFSYAATAALFERAEPDSGEWKRLQPWADTWETLARDRFLASYLRKSHEGRFLAPDRETLAVLLDFFEIDKALYELEYEIGHRPEWVRIPAAGIARVIERGERR